MRAARVAPVVEATAGSRAGILLERAGTSGNNKLETCIGCSGAWWPPDCVWLVVIVSCRAESGASLPGSALGAGGQHRVCMWHTWGRQGAVAEQGMEAMVAASTS
jgi:hypothetical protein